jgi:hypothetical protein
MGRDSTGAKTTDSVLSLKLKDLIKSGLFYKGREVEVSINFGNGYCVLATLYNSDYDCYLIIEDSISKYIIQIQKVPSNLGNGFVKYFVCPLTNKRCRTLYKTFQSNRFLSKECYKKLYYKSQLFSKSYRENDRYWDITRKIKTLESSVVKSHYNGKPTKLKERIERLKAKQRYLDSIRWGKAEEFIRRVRPSIND